MEWRDQLRPTTIDDRDMDMDFDEKFTNYECILWNKYENGEIGYDKYNELSVTLNRWEEVWILSREEQHRQIVISDIRRAFTSYDQPIPARKKGEPE